MPCLQRSVHRRFGIEALSYESIERVAVDDSVLTDLIRQNVSLFVEADEPAGEELVRCRRGRAEERQRTEAGAVRRLRHGSSRSDVRENAWARITLRACCVSRAIVSRKSWSSNS